ncbi:electron transfer flavoprotein, beta subunit [Heliomicrobium modesticaldum Ice1]|uniref:Electron transfer flavoprotein subunit beta n=1 Tax=Heliobacterium modesticaldum (strain ATCC 51547 / Ice1) TaxID=498761 RepID=B0TAM1_HELMI|nr:electron transfer flavoprotein subunit beta/FixA family protein [Heliomicrobium modesticaldum]ABZ83673.1 electron transfer flavoprotein, beta subunit [Heliomicrobium modesticaldum Ice1]
MKIAVLLKQTFDTEDRIVVKDGAVVPEGVTYIINPYDELAVEEALRIKEKAGQGEVVVISAGDGKVQEALRKALAMGADRAVRVDMEGLAVDEAIVATALATVIQEGGFDLVIGGWRAIDDGSAQVAVRVAEQLNLPQLNVVTKLQIEGGKAIAWREIDGGSEVIEAPLPALVTAQRGLNDPRYPNMKGIMQAKKKELKTVSASSLLPAGATAKVKVLETFLPQAKAAGKIFKDDPASAVQALVSALREEAKVI